MAKSEFKSVNKLYITKDGHCVRSRAEYMIDSLLADLELKHDYEIPLTLNHHRVLPDWVLPEYGVIIEFWGMINVSSYVTRMQQKLALYKKSGIPCLSIKDADLSNYEFLKDKVTAFLIRHKTKQINRRINNSNGSLDHRYCLFCNNIKKVNITKSPVCQACYQLVQLKQICTYCGDILQPRNGLEGFITIASCENCQSTLYRTCKLCHTSINQPVIGKPLCYDCYCSISIINSLLPIPRRIQRFNRRYRDKHQFTSP